MVNPRGDLLLGDEDRLPWLEPARPVRRQDSRAALRWVVFGLLVLALLIAIVAGGLWLTRPAATDGQGALIAAPKEPYKVRPPNPGGMRVDGAGDTAFAASDGRPPESAINLDAQPEAPVAATGTAPEAGRAPPENAGRSAQAAIPASEGRVSTTPAAPARAASAGGGRLVQLGSFNSDARAREAWRILSGRFSFLADRQPTVATGEVNGRQVYRLRLDAGGAPQARELCQRLTLGGEACLVVAP